MELTAQQREEMMRGRYWGSADIAKLTPWSDGEATIVLEWADGARLSLWEESLADAHATLRRLGYMK